MRMAERRSCQVIRGSFPGKKKQKEKHSGLRETLKRTPTHRWDIQVERKRANQEESVAKQKNGAKEVAAQQQMKRKQVQ